VEHMTALKQRFEIHLATSRLSQARERTLEWLDLNKIPFDRIHFVHHRKKHEIPVPFAAAVDDDREQAALFARLGVRAFLLAHPWNALGNDDRVVRVSDWSELVLALTNAFSQTNSDAVPPIPSKAGRP